MERYPIPPTLIVTKYKCVQLLIPDDPFYEAIFRGQVWGLTMWNAYQPDAARSGREIAENWYKTFDSIADCQISPTVSEVDDNMTVFRQEGCLLQAQCVDGSWVTIYDPSACITQASGQPGVTTPPVPGGCETINAKVDYGGVWLLPYQISGGDVVKITNADGAWQGFSNDAPIWRCPDGNVFILSGCVNGSSIFNPLDPAPTMPHDCLLAFDGTTYYDCSAAANGMEVTIAIPLGISAGKLTFIANNSANPGAGSVAFIAQYCKQNATLVNIINVAPSTATIERAGNHFRITSYSDVPDNLQAFRVQNAIIGVNFNIANVVFSTPPTYSQYLNGVGDPHTGVGITGPLFQFAAGYGNSGSPPFTCDFDVF